jgi:flavin-dependent dehydrogenase
MEKHENLIVGAGPSGCKAAQTLVEGGEEDVLVLEKTSGKDFAKKICSGMLPANNAAIFKIPKEVTDTYIDTIRMYFPSKIIEVKFPYPLCYMMDRRNGKFGRWLISETRKMGVEVREDSEALKIHKKDHLIELKNGEKIKYNNLIIANGSGDLFRKQLGLTTKSVLCTHIEVPYSDLPDKRKTVAHGYYIFDINGVGYCGYTPYKDTVGFCQVFCNNKFFTKRERIERFNEYVKKVEGVDLNDYEFLAKTVNYVPTKMRLGNNIWICGDSQGSGDVAGGLIYTAAKSGEIVAHDVLGYNITKELTDFNKKYNGTMRRFVGGLNNKFILKCIMENLMPKILANKFSGKIVYNLVFNIAAPLFTPFPEDEWNEFNSRYYTLRRFGYEKLEIKEI